MSERRPGFGRGALLRVPTPFVGYAANLKRHPVEDHAPHRVPKPPPDRTRRQPAMQDMTVDGAQ